MANIATNISALFTAIMSWFSSMLGFIIDNPVLYFSVLAALVGSLLVFAISLIRKFGVRGLASSGRRRRRRG